MDTKVGTAAGPEPDPDPEFNPEAFRLPQDFQTESGVQKILTTVPVGKPDKQVFFRIHTDPSFEFRTRLLDMKHDRETYIVDAKIWPQLDGDLAPYAIFAGINRQNDVFLLPIRLPGMDGRDNNWWASLRTAVGIAKEKWIRVKPNHPINSYDVLVAKDNDAIPLPTWPPGDMTDFLKIAFRGKIIASLDHPALKKLRGES